MNPHRIGTDAWDYPITDMPVSATFNRAAALAVCAHARDTDDAALLLSALGLDQR